MSIDVIVLGNYLAVLTANDSAAPLLPSPVHVLTGSGRCFFKPSPHPSPALAGKSKTDLLLFREEITSRGIFQSSPSLWPPRTCGYQAIGVSERNRNFLLGLTLLTEAAVDSQPATPRTPLQRHLQGKFDYFSPKTRASCHQ